MDTQMIIACMQDHHISYVKTILSFILMVLIFPWCLYGGSERQSPFFHYKDEWLSRRMDEWTNGFSNLFPFPINLLNQLYSVENFPIGAAGFWSIELTKTI